MNYKIIKRELIDDAQFRDINQTQIEIFKYIETYSNTNRMYSAFSYQSPRDFEKNSTHSIN
ncbi:IS3 family transposase [Enterococcus mundtii]|uniref:IS3 family transposase n=1 Tax=Enterococcus mundtii TaxID=53346 RepID=UPI000E1BB88C